MTVCGCDCMYICEAATGDLYPYGDTGGLIWAQLAPCIDATVPPEGGPFGSEHGTYALGEQWLA